jgi:hypothetical protein
MARPSIEFGHAAKAEIAARTARGESAETVARAMGMPTKARTIRRLQATLKGKPSAPRARPAAREDAPAAPATRDDKRRALLHAYANADNAEDVRAAAIALHRIDEPEFAAWLDRGLSVAEALSQSDPAVFDLLRTPEDVAYLARQAGDFFGCYVRDPGQSEQAFRAEVRQAHGDAHGRALALLEGALEILRRSGPEYPAAPK